MAKFYRRKTKNLGFKILLGIGAIAVIMFMAISFFYTQNDLQKLIDNTLLKNRVVSLSVKEITSQRNKIKGYLFEDKTNPIVSLNFVFKNSGLAGDDDAKQGMAKMVAALLTEGAGDYTATELKEELENKAIVISFNVGKDDFEGALLTTKSNLSKAISLLELILSNPRFDEDDINRVKQQMLEAIKRQKEHPNNELGLEFAKEVYGKHPYSRNPLGEKKDIMKITANDLRDFVHNNFTKNNLIVGVAGDVSETETSYLLDKIFGKLPTNGKINFVRNVELNFDGRVRQVKRVTGQNIWLAAMPSVSRNHKDFYPLFVANYIWGGSGLVSKLSKQIREQEGLTYGVYSYLTLDDKAPMMIVSFSATKDNFAKAKELLAKETNEFGSSGISAEELKKAKDYLVASYNLRFVSIQNISQILTAMQKYNLGLDFLQKRNEYIKQIELKDVNNVIKKYFKSGQIIGSEIGVF